MMDDPDVQRNWKAFLCRRRLHAVKRGFLKTLSFAALAALCVAGTLFFTKRDVCSPDSPAMLTTHVPAGHRAQSTLPDGTTVWLNAGSTLSYPAVFSGQRVVYLDGEGFFEVAPDKEHPFIVSTGKLNVKALGTKFDISNYKEDNLTVSLLEGSVSVYPEDREEQGIVLLPNEQLAESEGGYVKKSFVQDAILWVDGYHSFHNKTLASILSKLELYYDVKIISNNERLLNCTYTGKFRQTDGVIEILRVLSRVYPFSIYEDESTHTIYIR
jgi:ferric-dicitrate binding protein FerR (iron transport regulator)